MSCRRGQRPRAVLRLLASHIHLRVPPTTYVHDASAHQVGADRRDTCMAAARAGGSSGAPTPVILDTDIESDVDDVGAVAVLHALANRGEADIIGMGVSATFRWCVPCLDALNAYFGRSAIPIGGLREGPVEYGSSYCEKIATEYPHPRSEFTGDAPPAVSVYRRALAEAEDHSVVFITIGFLTNLAALLVTEPDEHSPLNGLELVRQKVRAWVCMGGFFEKDGLQEHNLKSDPAAAAFTAHNWPSPVVWSGFEVGVELETGPGLAGLDSGSPVRRAYEIYNDLTPRPSWDQLTVLYAVRGLGGGLRHWYDESEPGQNVVDQTGANRWQSEPTGRHVYLSRRAEVGAAEVASLIEGLMKEPPLLQ